MAPRKRKDETAPAAPAVKFEEALEKLEASVKRLDSNDLPLEEALAEYEKGLEALRLCRGILDAAKKRLEILVSEKDGEAEVEEFDPEGAETRAAKPVAASQKARVSRPPAPAGTDIEGDDVQDGGDGPEDKAGKGPRDGFLF